MAATACALSTSARPAKRTYARRRPEKTVLYELVREHLESFLEEGRRRSEHDGGLVPDKPQATSDLYRPGNEGWPAK